MTSKYPQLSTMSALDHRVMAEARGQDAVVMMEQLRAKGGMPADVLAVKVAVAQTIIMEAQLHATLAVVKR